MPKGPKGEKRPAHVIGNAVRVMRIATGEEAEEFETTDDGKDKAAQSMGRGISGPPVSFNLRRRPRTANRPPARMGTLPLFSQSYHDQDSQDRLD